MKIKEKFKKIKTAAFVVGGRVLAGGAAILLTIALTRGSTKEVVAAYGYAFTFVLMASVIVQFGFPQAIIRQIALCGPGEEQKKHKVVTLGLFVILLMTALFYAAMELYLKFYGNGLFLDKNSIGGIVLWLTLYSINGYFGEVFRAYGKINAATFYGGVLPSYILLAAIYFISKFSILTVADLYKIVNASYFLSIFISFSVLFHWAMIKINIKVNFDKRVLTACASNMIVILFSSLTLQANSIVIAKLGTVTEVANYLVAGRIISLAATVSALMAQIYSVKIAKMAIEGDKKDLQSQAEKLSVISIGLALPIYVAFMINPSWILGNMFGRGYEEAAIYVRIMMTGYMINSITGLRGQYLIHTGNEIYFSKLIVLFGFYSVISVYVAASFYGVIAGVSVSAINLAIMGIAEMMLLYKRTGLISAPRLLVRLLGREVV